MYNLPFFFYVAVTFVIVIFIFLVLWEVTGDLQEVKIFPLKSIGGAFALGIFHFITTTFH